MAIVMAHQPTEGERSKIVVWKEDAFCVYLCGREEWSVLIEPAKSDDEQVFPSNRTFRAVLLCPFTTQVIESILH